MMNVRVSDEDIQRKLNGGFTDDELKSIENEYNSTDNFELDCADNVAYVNMIHVPTNFYNPYKENSGKVNW